MSTALEIVGNLDSLKFFVCRPNVNGRFAFAIFCNNELVVMSNHFAETLEVATEAIKEVLLAALKKVTDTFECGPGILSRGLIFDQLANVQQLGE